MGLDRPKSHQGPGEQQSAPLQCNDRGRQHKADKYSDLSGVKGLESRITGQHQQKQNSGGGPVGVPRQRPHPEDGRYDDQRNLNKEKDEAGKLKRKQADRPEQQLGEGGISEDPQVLGITGPGWIDGPAVKAHLDFVCYCWAVKVTVPLRYCVLAVPDCVEIVAEGVSHKPLRSLYLARAG